MMRRTVIVLATLAMITSKNALAQQPTGESHKYRTLFTIVGGAGGLGVGLFAGIAAFDDSINSERKVTMTAALSGVGGAVGGYFLGRSIDRSKSKTTITAWPTATERALLPAGRTYPSLESLGILSRITPTINGPQVARQ